MVQGARVVLFALGAFAGACAPQTTGRPAPTLRDPQMREPAPQQQAVPSAPAKQSPNALEEQQEPTSLEADSPKAPDSDSPDDDPRLLERLTISVREPRALARPRFRAARAIFREILRGIAAGSYTETKAPGCQQALVSDETGVVRGFTQFGGSEHHYAEFRYYFDQAGTLRLLLYLRNDEAGGSTEDTVAFDPAGNIVACEHVEHHPGMPAPDLCADEEPEPDLDPEVRASLQTRAAHRPRNRLREHLQSVDPTVEFSGCRHSE